MRKETAKKEESIGTLIAAKEREKANGYSDERRQHLLDRGMAMIYGGLSHAEASVNRS